MAKLAVNANKPAAKPANLIHSCPDGPLTGPPWLLSLPDVFTAPLLPRAGANFKNPFNNTATAFVDQGTWTIPLASGSTTAGVTAYGDSSQMKYQVAGVGKNGDLTLVLSSGQ